MHRGAGRGHAPGPDKKLYLDYAKNFNEFCQKHFHTSKENATRLIRLLEEFGPTYFEVAQLTRISPATYRAIAPAIRDQTLHHNGEAIALIPENAGKVAAAVAEVRKTVTIKPAVEPDPDAPSDNPVRIAVQKCNEAVAAIEQVMGPGTHSACIHAALCYLRSRLSYMEMTM